VVWCGKRKALMMDRSKKDGENETSSRASDERNMDEGGMESRVDDVGG
jgi:hypothetical protein